MAILSAAEIIQNMITAIALVRPNVDTSEGTLARDIAIEPPANEMEDMYAEIEHVSLIHSLFYPDEMSTDEMDRLVFNYGITRNDALSSTATVVGRRSTAPTEDIVIPSGVVVSTAKDANGNSIKFASTSSNTFLAADAATYYNVATGFYEFPFGVEAQVSGTTGNVGASQITVLETTVPNIDTVNNTAAATGGTEQETNADLADRTLLALTGNNIGTEDGYLTFVREYDLVFDALLVGPGDDLMVRDNSIGGKVDIYINIDTASSGVLTTATDTYTYTDLSTGGLGATNSANDRRLASRPVFDITSVEGSTSGTFTSGVDYQYTVDTGNNALSTRSQDKIQWLLDSPIEGETITITYRYYLIVETIQNALDEVRIITADILIKVADQVNIDVTASVTTDSTITNATTFAASVSTALETYLDRRTLSGNIQQSDIIAIIQGVSGTDSTVVPLDKLARSGQSGTADIALTEKEFSNAGTITINVTLGTD